MNDKEMLAWVKANVKDGANVAEFEESFSRMAIPDSQAEALEYIKRTPSLRSALDSEKNREYDRAIEKYKLEKLPDHEKAIRETIYKELNPQETPEQKELREIREERKQEKLEKALADKKLSLVEKAKEFGLDPSIGVDYALYGDDAETIMKKHADYINSRIESVKNETVRGIYNNGNQKAGTSGVKPPNVMDEYNKRLAAGDRDGANLLYIQMQRQNKEVN